MKVRWLVAKYMADLRRREPINVGVVLIHGDQRLFRFLGQRSDGKLDGRRIRWAGSLDTYKSWVAYWQHAACTVSANSIGEVLTRRRSDDNYIVEYGGERLVGAAEQSPEDLLDHLYEVLVESAFERTAPSVARLSESLFNRLGIADVIKSNFRHELKNDAGATDLIRFDYRYDNGRINLMQGVSLANPDERSWDSVHAAAWSFSRVAASPIVQAKSQQLIALIKTRAPDPDQTSQVALLSEHAKVVDLVDENIAADHLQQLLHLPS